MDNAEQKRDIYESLRRKDLTAYAGMLGDEFIHKVNRLSSIIGDSHEQSLGEYKERLLANFIRRFIPRRYAVGTGFILFPKKRHIDVSSDENPDFSNLKEHEVSKQLDIIIYDEIDYSPVFSDDYYVVVKPEAVRVIVEVKGFLRASAIHDSMNKFIDIAVKWNSCRDFYRFRTDLKLSAPGMFLMAWDVAIDKRGTQLSDGKRLRETIVKDYKKHLPEDLIGSEPFPTLSAAYIYNDCCVNECLFLDGVDGESTTALGYSTNRGKFVRYDDSGLAVLGGDKTIMDLLAYIYVHIDSPFNPILSYFDQSNVETILPHEKAGKTPWIFGDDAYKAIKTIK